MYTWIYPSIFVIYILHIHLHLCVCVCVCVCMCVWNRADIWEGKILCNVYIDIGCGMGGSLSADVCLSVAAPTWAEPQCLPPLNQPQLNHLPPLTKPLACSAVRLTCPFNLYIYIYIYIYAVRLTCPFKTLSVSEMAQGSWAASYATTASYATASYCHMSSLIRCF